MLEGVNDSDENAHELADLLLDSIGAACKVNLIHFNAWPGSPFQPSPNNIIMRFAGILQSRGIYYTVRLPKGADIGAACGQLAVAEPKTA